MTIVVVTHADVERLLPMPECIQVMEQALAALARGQVHQPLRLVMRPPGAAGVMALMPSYAAEPEPAFALKAIGIFEGNTALGLDTHQGSVLLFDGQTGELRALMNAAAVTAIRTAAVSGVATRLLARADAGDLAVIGAGVQARSHVEALSVVRRLRRVRIASRRLENARRLAADLQARYGFPVEAVETVEAAVRGADLIVTATSARAPIVARAWIAPGAHLNVVGASTPDAREVDSATLAAARLYADRRESLLSEAGDYLLAAAEGAVGPEHIQGEIGEVLIGARPGRGSDEEITLFKSLGLAVEDLFSARHVYRQAVELGLGTRVEF